MRPPPSPCSTGKCAIWWSASAGWRTITCGDRDIRGLSHYEVFPEVPERWKRDSPAMPGGGGGELRGRPLPASRWQHRLGVLGGSALAKADNSIGGIIIFSELITERKRAEEALAESELRTTANCSNGRKARWGCTRWYLTRRTILATSASSMSIPAFERNDRPRPQQDSGMWGP